MENFREAIDQSDILLCLATESYFQDAKCFAQLLEAVELKKKIIVLLKEGVHVPPDFQYLFLSNGALVGEWSDTESLHKVAMVLIERVENDLDKQGMG